MRSHLASDLLLSACMSDADWIPDDLFWACADGNAEAWAEFLNRYGTLIRITALRIARRYQLQGELESIIADFYGDLYRRRDRVLRTFECQWDGADASYLKKVTANAVSTICHNIVRIRKHEHAAGVIPDPRPQHEAGPEITFDEALRILERELNLSRAVRAIVIFILYYRDGYTAAEIARIRGFSLAEAGVEAVLHTSRKILRSTLSAAKAKRVCPPITAVSIKEEGGG